MLEESGILAGQLQCGLASGPINVLIVQEKQETPLKCSPVKHVAD